MGFKEFFGGIGEKTGDGFAKITTDISEKIGINPTNIQSKILTLILISLAIYFGTKIAHKIAKFLIIILSVLLGSSIILSLFLRTQLNL